MINRITIRDVAEKAGVSISTVHQALNGKKGVGDETRSRIQEVAASLGYQPNPMASNLKRKAKRIAVIFPRSAYYKTVWSGARDYLDASANLNLECIEMPYSDGERQGAFRDEFFAGLDQQHIDGILITGHSDVFSRADWQSIESRGIAVTLLGADLPMSHRIFCVLPDYEIIGRTMAELLLSRIPPFGSIALCAGNPKWEPHAKVVQGFDAYLEQEQATNRVYRNYSWDGQEDSLIDVIRMISQPDVAACCSVLSQSSVLLGRALQETGKAGKVFAVGSDLSPENITFLQSGVFNNLIEKNPYAQGYLGAKV